MVERQGSEKMMLRRLSLVVVFTIVATACGGGRAVTEKRMLDWGPMLNMYMGSNFENGNSYPETLDELPPEFSSELERNDGWGNPFLYRLIRVDRYNLISAGPDGEFGNEDDVVMENGAFFDPMKIYAEKPLKK
jgi:hypothetical protein